jgi:hypothetical protein
VHREPKGILAGFTLHAWPEGGDEALASWVLWWDRRRGWTDEPDVITEQLEAAARSGEVGASELPLLAQNLIDAALERLAGQIRQRMRQLGRSRWLGHPTSAATRTVIARLQALARTAARRRDGDRLGRLQRALGFVAGGHTAGERALIGRLADVADGELEAVIARLPAPRSAVDALHCRLTGLIVFAP